jgi:hypothetical protein
MLPKGILAIQISPVENVQVTSADVVRSVAENKCGKLRERTTRVTEALAIALALDNKGGQFPSSITLAKFLRAACG